MAPSSEDRSTPGDEPGSGRTPSADRPPLSRDRIVTAAVGLADEDGLSKVSMRTVAAALDYEVMSLYNHVANKSDLVDAMVDHVWSSIELPDGEDWRTAIHRFAGSAHVELLEHHWAAGLFSSTSPGPARIQRMEALLRTLDGADLGDAAVYHGYHAVVIHIAGMTQQAAEFPYSQEELAELAPGFVESMPDALPHLAKHVLAHAHDHGDEFAIVLDLILDGLERSRLD